MFGLTLGILVFCLFHQGTVTAPITNIDGIINLAVATAAKSLMNSKLGTSNLRKRGEEARSANSENLSPRDDNSSQPAARSNPAVHLARRGIWSARDYAHDPGHFNGGYGSWNSFDGWDHPGFSDYPYGGDYIYPHNDWGGRHGWNW
ncbi:hypothetical protein IWQ61_007740 [Dispira simplex]|nr:hypothetical protein IWQ61_007740 [Dispira simplex]